jgi:broad specificity phosphatase PhoE
MENTELSDLGKKQAELTAGYLKDKGIQKIFTSPLRRTQQTASIIDQQLQLGVTSDDRLKERLLYGDIPDISFEDFLIEWDKTSADRNYRPPEGDSAVMAGKRLQSLIEEVDSKDSVILIITHGGIIGDFLRNNFPEDLLPFQTDMRSPIIPIIRYVEILECSITLVEKDDKKYSLKTVNHTAHLPLPII